MPIITAKASSGGSMSVSLVLECSGLAIGTVATHDIKWTNALDNLWDANVLAALPAGIGLTVAFNGSDATITTTANGVWALAWRVVAAAGNAGYVGTLHDSLGLANVPVPVRAALDTDTGLAGTVYLPSGASFAPGIVTTTAPAAQSLFAQLVITRLA